jgi:predicted amidohydrolase YtcJ
VGHDMDRPQVSRRRLIEFVGAGLGSLLWTPPGRRAWSQEPERRSAEPDFIVVNAKVYTVDASLPQAEAFAVRHGHFLAVGSSADIRNLAGRRTHTFDAQRMTIVPGFIDCHNHVEGETLLYDVLVGDPFEVKFVTIDSIIDKLRKRASETPPGTWVVGQFFDDTKVLDKRQLNVHDLDKVSADHPVVVHHRGGHTAFYNSRAFQLAKISRDTPNPSGGTFDRDADGQLNGRVTDNAMDVFDHVGVQSSYTPAVQEQRSRAGLAYMSRQFVRYGLTSVHHESGDLKALQQIRASGDLKHRVSYEAEGKVLDGMIANGIETGFGDEWLRFGATSEYTVDGSFSERTMALSVPYAGRSDGYRGNVTVSQDELNDWAERVHRAGIQPNCHANGDVAIGMTLTAYERALKLYPTKDVRPKITHCTLINDDLLRRMKAMDAVPAPFTTYAYYNSDKFHFYGEELMRRCMAFRSFLDAGIRVAAGSDFGPGPFAPLMGIQGMVTRTGWNGETWGANQRVTVDEAILINTLNGAYNSHEEAIKGSISPGKLADFVVLGDDPHTVDPARIKDIKIYRTVTGGETVYQA